MSTPTREHGAPASFQPVGTAIRQRREALGLTQDDLAQRLGLRKQDLARIESGQVLFPSWPRLLRIAEALDCSAEDLITAPSTDGTQR